MIILKDKLINNAKSKKQKKNQWEKLQNIQGSIINKTKTKKKYLLDKKK